MDLTPETWTDRYINADTGWDIGYVSTPLAKYFDGLADKQQRVLIPGGGNGHEAELLWHKGFSNVFLLDWAQQPLTNFNARVPGFPSSHLLHQDFFQHQGQYDLILEQTFFCAIDPALRLAYADKVYDLLAPKGRLVGLLFNATFEKDGPPFGGNKQEYLTYFSPKFNIHKMEPCYNSIAPRAGRELFINLQKPNDA